MRLYRPTIPSGILCTIIAAYILFVTNISFWTRAKLYFADQPNYLVMLAIALLLLYIAGITIFSVRFIVKPFLIFLVLVSVGAGYYTDTYGLIIDRHVIESTFETTSTEASHLLTTRMIIHMLIYGLIPSLLIIWVRVTHKPFFKKSLYNTAWILCCFIAGIVIVFVNLSTFSSMYRIERAQMMEKLMPVTPLKSTVQYVADQFKSSHVELKPLGQDAQNMLSKDPARKKRLLVIVVGETSRAQSFSLGGYNRDTNPELEKRDIIYFPNTTSCGTETSVSVPCMFSVYPRKEYSGFKGKNTENVMDIINRVGIKTYWFENDTGSKGVADRILMKQFQDVNDPKYCTSPGECRDQILVDELKKNISSVKDDTVIVLHTIGSHGPAYYMRYPTDIAKFKPECLTSDFKDCTPEQIVNSYDNTIVYVDKMLSEIVDTLKADTSLDTSMIYMSDHGESLGENGLYLHAMPYAVAPSQQTHIPFISWFSQGFAQEDGLNVDCIRAHREQNYSHDNLFHSVLGLMSIKTSVYDPKLDAFAECRLPEKGMQ